ncbi:MAG TPA: hypothetical protein PK629_03385 [Oscillospiraceae bacterium]|nr:hypothetical protein [Oscillospiraceae bacterium]HPK34745.1 hypothetical protein [Oscillospiraceae bacterium]
MRKILIFVFAGLFLFSGCSNTGKVVQVDLYQPELPAISLNIGYWSYIDNNGDLYTWGYDGRNAGTGSDYYPGDCLGQGTEVVYNNVPTKGYSNVAYVLRGNRGLTQNGEIIEWGKCFEDDSCTPQIVKESVAKTHLSLYLTKNGELYTIPESDNFQLSGSYGSRNELVMTGVKDFALGYSYFALKDDGSVWTFSVNSMTAEVIESPKKFMDGVERIIAESSFDAAVLFLKSDGTLWSCGNNEFGQCGNGEHGDLDIDTRDCVVSKPFKMAENVTNAWVTDWTTFYQTKENNLYACGENYNDLLLLGGNGQMNLDAYPKFIETPVLIMESVKQMEYSDMGMFVLKTDGTVWTWGYADKGFLGNGICYIGDDLSPNNFFKREAINAEALYSQPTQIMDHVNRLFTETLGLHFVQKTDGTIWYWGFGYINVEENDDWDRNIPWQDTFGNVITAYQKHYIIPTPIEFSVDTFFQNALDSIAAQGIDVSQYDVVKYTED